MKYHCYRDKKALDYVGPLKLIALLPSSTSTSTTTLTKVEIGINFVLSDHPPTRTSSYNCDISAVTDPILIKN